MVVFFFIAIQPLVARELILEPDTLAIGPVIPGAQAHGDVRLSNPGNDKMELSVRISGAGFRVESEELVLMPEESLTLRVTYHASQTGEYSGELLFEVRGFLRKDTYPVPLSATVAMAQVTLDPPVQEGLQLDPVAPGQETAGSIRLRNTGPVPVTLDSVFLSRAVTGFSVSAPTRTTLSPGQAVGIDIGFAPDSGGTYTEQLVMVIPELRPSRLELPIRAEVLAPRMAVSPLPEVGFDFGEVALGSTRTRRLTVLNQGQADLYLTQIEASSGAYQLEFDPDTQALIMPGERLELPVYFNPRYEGRAAARLMVAGNDPGNPQVELPLIGTASQTPPRIVILNDEQIDFGNVAVGDRERERIIVWNRGGAPFTVNMDLQGVAPADFELELPSVLLQPGDLRRIAIHFEPRDTGERRAQVLVSTESGEEALNLLGTGRFLDITPSTVDLGSVVVGNNASVAAEILNFGNADFTITNIVSSNPEIFALETQVSPTNRFVLPAEGARPLPLGVVFTPQSRGVYNGVIQIQGYWDNTFESREILLQGTGIAADLELHPSGPYQFGYVVLGEERAQSIVATNTGDTDLHVEAHPDSEGAQLVPGEFSLPPGASKTLHLVFRPMALGDRTPRIHLISNAMKEKAMPLQVMGKGALDNIDLERVVAVLASRKARFDTLKVPWNNTPLMQQDETRLDVVFRIPPDMREAMIGRRFFIEWTRLDANFDPEGGPNKLETVIQDAGESRVLLENLNLRLRESDNRRVRLKISTQNHPEAPVYGLSQIFAAGGWKWEFEAKPMVSFFSVRPGRDHVDEEGNLVEGSTERLIGLPAFAFFGFHNSESPGLSGIHLTAIGNVLEALSTENSIAVSLGVAVSFYKDRFMFGIGRDVYDNRPRAKRASTSNYIMTFKYWGLMGQ